MEYTFYQLSATAVKQRNYNVMTFARLNKFLALALLVCALAYGFLAQQTLSLEKNILETESAITQVATETSALESELSRALSPAALEIKASVLNLVGTKTASYLFENALPPAARR